jgi:acetyl coenzyme A synthetase (ADP forming)-like protein
MEERERSAEPLHFAGDVVLADGRPVHVRAARAGDREALRAFHARLSPETVYFRYFSAKPRLSERFVDAFTRVDPENHLVLFAIAGEEIVGMASYHRLARGDAAEVAFVVDDAHQGRGIGTVLLEHLAAIARRHGLHRFVADMVPGNRKMLAVFRDSGLAREHRLEGGVAHLAFPIEPTETATARIEEREHLSEAISIAHLLAPRSIAVVGAGRSEEGLGRQVFDNLLASGFEGPVYPVNPHAERIAGHRAYPRLAEVPDDIDLVVVAVPAEAVAGVVREAAARRGRGIVVISAGFSEVGPDGAARERELVEFARRNGMRVVGPNCLGVVNTAANVRMNASFAPTVPPPGPIGFLSQSGALGVAILARAKELGLGISSFVSVGNKADVSANDLLQFWEDDPATQVVLLYLESFGNPRKFARIARRVSRKKPIVAVKSGRTPAGKRGAASHTAALASAEAAVDALFRQVGVIRVDALEELFDVAQLLAGAPLPPGRRVAVVGNSGGPGILAADACEAAGLEVPEFSGKTRARLARLVPGAAVANPVDLLAGAGAVAYEGALDLALSDPAVDSAVAIFTPLRGRALPEYVRAIGAAARRHPRKPVLGCIVTGEAELAALRLALSKQEPELAALPLYAFPESAVRALGRASAYAAWRARPAGVEPKLASVDAERAREIASATLAAAPQGAWLDPERASELLRCHGIDLVRAERVESVREACAAAERIGFPVVLKAGSPALLHKTEAGGVALGLGDAAAVRAAWTRMRRRLGEAMGGGLVQEQVETGVETIVGVVQDPAFGPLVMFGLGGVATEVLGDRAFRIVPLTDLDARELVREIRGAPLLLGYRGGPQADLDALEELLLRVARLAEDLPELAEMDLNPVCATAKGARAVDVRARIAPAPSRPDPTLRRMG